MHMILDPCLWFITLYLAKVLKNSPIKLTRTSTTTASTSFRRSSPPTSKRSPLYRHDFTNRAVTRHTLKYSYCHYIRSQPIWSIWAINRSSFWCAFSSSSSPRIDCKTWLLLQAQSSRTTWIWPWSTSCKVLAVHSQLAVLRSIAVRC